MALARFIDGAALGLLMGSVFIVVSMLSLFMVMKNHRERMTPMMEKYSPMKLAMGIVATSYPTWAVIGGMLALVYRISLEHAPGGGIGSPNMAFTLGVVAIAVMLAAPLAIVLRGMLAGVLTIALLFVGIFGWFLPYFAV